MTNFLADQVDLEAFRSGYPRYAKLLSTDTSFQNFRRFTRSRLRLLLVKQDEIAILEEELDSIDRIETHELFLGCIRKDGNTTRKDKLEELRQALEEYDTLLFHCQQAQCCAKASQRDIENLQKWVTGTRSLARNETKYLDQDDLANVTGSAENVINEVENLVEDCVFWFRTILHQDSAVLPIHETSGPRMQVFVSRKCVRMISRVLTTFVATLVVVAPIAILDQIKGTAWRIAVIFLSAAIFLSCVSLFTRARTAELFAAGASYTAVLVVFTATGNSLEAQS